MIKLTDIPVSVFKDPDDPYDRTFVTTNLERHDQMTISPKQTTPEVIERVKEMVRAKTLDAFFGDMRDPLAELERIALMNMDSSQMDTQKLIDQIHAVMEGRG